VPQLAGRIAAGSRSRKDLAEIAPAGIAAELTKLYYEPPTRPMRRPMAALPRLRASSQIVFGSDYPYYTVSENVDGLPGSRSRPRNDRRSITAMRNGSCRSSGA